MKLLFAVLLILGLLHVRYVIQEPVSKTRRQTIICPGQSFHLGATGNCLERDSRDTGKPVTDRPAVKSNGGKATKSPGRYVRKASNPEIEGLIRAEALKQGYADIEFALDLADCESTFRPDAKNVNKDGTVDLGVFQINQYWHKIGRTCSLDAKCNIQYAISKLKAGGKNLWSCTKKVRA